MPYTKRCTARLDAEAARMCGRIRSYADAAVRTRGAKVRLTLSPQRMQSRVNLLSGTGEAPEDYSG